VLPRIKAGDFVLVVFGINDGGPPRSASARGSIPGIGDETVDCPGRMAPSKPLTPMAGIWPGIFPTPAPKGARVYVLTVTARNIWNNPKAKFRDATITSQEEGYNPRTTTSSAAPATAISRSGPPRWPRRSMRRCSISLSCSPTGTTRWAARRS